MKDNYCNIIDNNYLDTLSLFSIFYCHFEISGFINKDIHPLKIFILSSSLLNFHLEISGILYNEIHSENK